MFSISSNSTFLTTLVIIRVCYDLVITLITPFPQRALWESSLALLLLLGELPLIETRRCSATPPPVAVITPDRRTFTNWEGEQLLLLPSMVIH